MTHSAPVLPDVPETEIRTVEGIEAGIGTMGGIEVVPEDLGDRKEGVADTIGMNGEVVGDTTVATIMTKKIAATMQETAARPWITSRAS